MDYSEQLKLAIESNRLENIHHSVFKQMKRMDDVKLFMQFHVYAVWDFMSLLKTLQQELTCTSIPWFPKGDAEIRYLINEIVIGEESDIDSSGNRVSHFELYLRAMEESGADTKPILRFVESLINGKSLEESFEIAETPIEARDFVRFTFQIIASKKVHLIAAIFTFGREDLIPDMFHSLIKDLKLQSPQSLDTFQYYLQRHIEVDGGHHSILALKMVNQLCMNSIEKWEEATQVVIQSLHMRTNLWNGIEKEINKLEMQMN